MQTCYFIKDEVSDKYWTGEITFLTPEFTKSPIFIGKQSIDEKFHLYEMHRIDYPQRFPVVKKFSGRYGLTSKKEVPIEVEEKLMRKAKLHYLFRNTKINYNLKRLCSMIAEQDDILEFKYLIKTKKFEKGNLKETLDSKLNSPLFFLKKTFGYYNYETTEAFAVRSHQDLVFVKMFFGERFIEYYDIEKIDPFRWRRKGSNKI